MTQPSNLHAKNRYHLLAFVPVVEREGMLVDLEELAEDLVATWQLRIDTGSAQNFVHLTLPHHRLSLSVSRREIEDPRLFPKTEAMLRQIMKTPTATEKALRWIDLEFKKHAPVSHRLEKQLARLLVKSSHPAVIRLLILERVEVFIGYDFTVGGYARYYHLAASRQ